MSVELGAVLRPVFMKEPLEFIRLVHRRYLGVFRSGMRFPTYSDKTARLVANSADRVRYGTLALALQTIERERVSGDLAELGVWRGATSTFLHYQMPQRALYLFDTFAGFPGESDADGRFRDTSVDAVRRRIGDDSNVIFRVGTFPGTTLGMESERFACVLLDADKYAPTLAGLEFFYPRMTRGGYMFIHDYNSPESEHGVSRAVNEFLQGKPERVVEIPDIWGSVLFRKF
jgi:O-methyltransferase